MPVSPAAGQELGLARGSGCRSDTDPSELSRAINDRHLDRLVATDHARYEVYEGGVLVVSPASGVGRQRASYRLHRALAQAAIIVGADVEASSGCLLTPARLMAG